MREREADDVPGFITRIGSNRALSDGVREEQFFKRQNILI